jgi:hypothetical protein
MMLNCMSPLTIELVRINSTDLEPASVGEVGTSTVHKASGMFLFKIKVMRKAINLEVVNRG